MSAALALSRAIDATTGRLGTLVGWLVPVAVLLACLNALARYGAHWSSNALLELQWVLFGTLVLLGAADVLRTGDHIRVDVLYGRLSGPSRAAVDLAGHVLVLVPVCLLMLCVGLPYALRSLALNETSPNAGGLPLWPAKFLVPACFGLLLAQALSEIIKRAGALLAGQRAPVTLA